MLKNKKTFLDSDDERPEANASDQQKTEDKSVSEPQNPLGCDVVVSRLLLIG